MKHARIEMINVDADDNNDTVIIRGHIDEFLLEMTYDMNERVGCITVFPLLMRNDMIIVIKLPVMKHEWSNISISSFIHQSNVFTRDIRCDIRPFTNFQIGTKYFFGYKDIDKNTREFWSSYFHKSIDTIVVNYKSLGSDEDESDKIKENDTPLSKILRKEPDPKQVPAIINNHDGSKENKDLSIIIQKCIL